MTVKRLSQYHALKREIDDLCKRLETLRAAAYGAPIQSLSGMPFGTGVGKPTEDDALALEELEALIQGRLKKARREYYMLNKYISSIDDSFLRYLFTARYCDLKKWEEIADALGGNNNADNVKKTVYRYLKKKKRRQK